MPNRLANEKSAYLKQHANNPVHWFAWGQEAFEKARNENKALLVSIGYSTCHWCHVMEHESFEDVEVAELLNANFVAVKVDREEHPDVDHFFMSALHLMNERGGWPLNMFVTPQGKPFFGGTYFPKAVLMDLLGQIDRVWKEQPDKVEEQAQSVVAHLQKIALQKNVSAGESATARLSLDQARALEREALAKVEHTLLQQFDSQWGGFGPAPKFPRPHSLTALLRAALRENDGAKREASIFAVGHTLRAMAYGGLRDHLRGGFHRYSTDERWLVPHFEKMLYDQALLIWAYSDFYRVTRETFAADVVGETLDYLEAEMRLPEGGFAAAQDADSEGVEGKYYVWSEEEIRELLAGEPSELVNSFLKLHSITSAGNWEGVNVLAAPLDVPWQELSQGDMKRLRAKLLQARRKRVPPLKDSKVIVSWNAWMASALLRASLNLFDRPELSTKLLHAAERSLVYLLSLSKDRKLPHVVYGREAKNAGYLEDYAAFVEALQLLSLRKLDAAPLRLAREYLQRAGEMFRDSAGRLKPCAQNEGPTLACSELEDQDGATPSALSVFVGAEFRQALFESHAGISRRALGDLEASRFILERHPLALSHLLTELEVLSWCVIKVPDSKLEDFWKAWAREKILGGSLLFAPTESKNFELCDLETCFAQSESADRAFSEARQREREWLRSR
jgi:uncharacterized protein YyaL (SSP411 family)